MKILKWKTCTMLWWLIKYILCCHLKTEWLGPAWSLLLHRNVSWKKSIAKAECSYDCLITLSWVELHWRRVCPSRSIVCFVLLVVKSCCSITCQPHHCLQRQNKQTNEKQNKTYNECTYRWTPHRPAHEPYEDTVIHPTKTTQMMHLLFDLILASGCGCWWGPVSARGQWDDRTTLP